MPSPTKTTKKTPSSAKSLVIVESPAKEKTIKKYLGSNFTVKASVGHIRDLPKKNEDAVEIDNDFKPHYQITPGKEHVVEEIKKAAAKADVVYLATDPDREGEAIAWHVKEAADLKKPKRVVFHEITKDAVQDAIRHPRTIDTNLKEAQEARRVLDRLFGYDLSGLIWKKLRYGLSAGRVQSPALRILAEREREIQAFVPTPFWVITANLKPKTKAGFVATCSEEPTDEKRAREIIATATKKDWHVKDVKEQTVTRKPRPPFITSTLQQAASSRLGFSPSRTMRLAQKLYEAGHITYMRTDSTNLAKEALAQIVPLVKERFGENYLETHTFSKKSKSAQEAHEAIRPTAFANEEAGANADQKKVYRLIWQRTMASQMASAKITRTTIIANTVNDDLPDFRVTGSQIAFDGWFRADPGARGEETEVPGVKTGEPLTLKDIDAEGKETQPPSRYSEAGLVKELEKRGIGRPSTYASIIQTLQDREYVEKDGKALTPTDTGMVVSGFLEDHFMEYINDDFTSEMEETLDKIAEGNADYVGTLKNFWKPFHKAVESKADIDKITNLGKADKKFKCPKCGTSMVIKLGRGGKFLSCSKFPDCDGALMIDGTEIKSDEPIGQHSKTGENIYLLTGRFGPYVQLGEMPEKGDKKAEKPKRASVPKEKDLSDVTLKDAEKYLSLPRDLGEHPKTGEPVKASIGRFGPYVWHNDVYASLKKDDDVYAVKLDRAVEILKEKEKRQKAKEKKKQEKEEEELKENKKNT
ncbi:MAG: type I DNA topoisomerase [Candidatus Paceibacterota bacterium]